MTSARRCATAGAALVVALTGCTTSGGGAEDSTSETAPAPCGGTGASTVADDRLTIATYDPVFAPWFVSNDPGNGQGFESALGFQAAKRMGFEPHQVRWVRVPFEEIIHPKKSRFDLALAEVSITPDRKKDVQFSTPYTTTRQAVLTHGDGPIAKNDAVNDLRGVRLGASVQTTSMAAIESVIKPSKKPSAFPTIAKAAEALDQQKVDGVVVDVPTAEYLASSRLDGGRLLGVLPGTDEQVGAVLPKGSDLTECLNRALAHLRGSGAIADLEKEWLPAQDALPKLKHGGATQTKAPPKGSPGTSSGKPSKVKASKVPSSSS